MTYDEWADMDYDPDRDEQERRVEEKLLDMSRMLKNRVWQQLGPEALAEIERQVDDDIT
jgi:hypothetical protein